jgi:ribonuclease HI
MARRLDASRPLFGAERPTRPKSYVVARIDGGARGNPGPAGYGAVLEDEQGRRLTELSQYLGHRTNNYAEYAGLIAVLEYAKREAHAAIEVRSDSELLVRQMRGQYKVKSPELRPLYERSRELSAGFSWFAIEHVPREKNRDADRLANQAMDEGSGKPRPQEVMGVVRDGVVELEGELPEGARVRVRVVR